MEKINLDILEYLLDSADLKIIKKELEEISLRISKLQTGSSTITVSYNGFSENLNSGYLEGEINQIIETRTIERTRYYLKRLIKGLTESRTGRINDLNLNRWKEYDDLLTDSLWIMKKRERAGEHKADYWGNFIPQIPNQLLRRYTKKGEWVLDPFLGSGTTLIEAKRLGRNGIGIELIDEIAESAEKIIGKEKNHFDAESIVIKGDSSDTDYKKILAELKINSVQFLLMHPPYWDIIKFSDNPKDLCNSTSIKEFINLFGKVVSKTYSILEDGRYFALVVGDKYSGGEWIPLGFYLMQEVLKYGYSLKSIIIKNFDETKGKRAKKELWRYRALTGGFYVFKHEYIFLFRKQRQDIIKS